MLMAIKNRGKKNKVRVLVFTTVYPNKSQPNLGIFVENRIKKMADYCDIRVLAPIPHFPFASLIKSKYKRQSANIEDRKPCISSEIFINSRGHEISWLGVSWR